MSNKKQLLILDDLGISQDDFEKTAKKDNLPFDIVWDENLAEREKVKGIITIKTKIDQSFLEKFPDVNVIAVAFTGFDCVDLALCKKNRIAVYNVPSYSTNSVAELAVGLAISMLREIPSGDKIIRSGKWSLKPGKELSGKTVGILGTGSIGLLVAKYFKTFGCKIVGWSRTEKETFKELGDYIPDINEFFSTPDIVSIHLPLNSSTKGMIGEDELANMKPSAFLINTARGALIDEAALTKTLTNNKIAGAALDVFEKEPIDPNHPLLQLDNVILTPHIAYKTEEALKRRAKVTIENLINFTKNNKTNQVN
jgi:lactate dehydrogenase-like 2-hydroxyacid dehydrogenase